eukprot:52802_1
MKDMINMLINITNSNQTNVTIIKKRGKNNNKQPNQQTRNNTHYQHTNNNQIPTTSQLTYEIFEKFMNILFEKMKDMINMLINITNSNQTNVTIIKKRGKNNNKQLNQHKKKKKKKKKKRKRKKNSNNMRQTLTSKSIQLK